MCILDKYCKFTDITLLFMKNKAYSTMNAFLSKT